MLIVFSLSQSTLSFLRPFLSPTATMARKKITGDELSARAKANGHQRGAHQDKDSFRDQNKHVDKVKRIKMQRCIVTSCERAFVFHPSKAINTDVAF